MIDARARESLNERHVALAGHDDMMAPMLKKNRTLTIVVIIAVVLALVGILLYSGPAARDARGNDAARVVLETFGSKLKNVPLLGDSAAVDAAIDENYAPYVTAELLADWKANHAHAPGRLTSSPSPERLGITSFTVQGAGRIAVGEVILVASGETVDTVPFVAQLIPTDGGWKIAAYQEEAVQTLKKLPTTDEDIPGAK